MVVDPILSSKMDKISLTSDKFLPFDVTEKVFGQFMVSSK